MRYTIIGLTVATTVMASAAPAMACGYNGGCTSGFNTFTLPTCGLTACGGGYVGGYYGQLPYPYQPYGAAPQYYYVNQGPTFTGPGLFAPTPTYQPRTVSGWYGAPAVRFYGRHLRRHALMPRYYRTGYGMRYHHHG